MVEYLRGLFQRAFSQFEEGLKLNNLLFQAPLFLRWLKPCSNGVKSLLRPLHTLRRRQAQILNE